jgi:hypothetical protein
MSRFLLVFGCAAILYGQAQPKDPDTLIFTNGEKLIGHLVKSVGGSVTFKSDNAGTVTVDWSKIKELHSADRFAVIKKGTEIHKGEAAKDIPVGTVAVADQKIEVTPQAGAPQTVTAADTGFVVSAASFEKATGEGPGFFQDWHGGVTGGLSLVEATQTSQTYTAALALVRTEPSEDWLDKRNRTLVDFNVAYGKVTEPGSVDIKTEIFHFNAERDEYVSKKLFFFAQGTFDHNYSQGLNLQQLYGGGMGYTLIQKPNQQLDLRVAGNYIDQDFSGAPNKSLVGITFGDTYSRKLPHGITFNQGLLLIPTINNTNDYSAVFNAGLVLPTYKRLSTSVTTLDTFLNDPPSGFRKNSFQLSVGLTYVLR